MLEDESEFGNISSRIRQKHVRVHLNGKIDDWKALQIGEGWGLDDLLNAAQQRLDLASTPHRVFNSDGLEVTDVMMLEDDAIIFVSNGADFAAPTVSKRVGEDEHDLQASGLPELVGGFTVKGFLGKGGFGEVRVGDHMLTGEKVALKFLAKSEIANMGAAERTTTEIQCLTSLKHPGIIRLLQHIDSPQYVVLAFELMEGGDMFHYLSALPDQRLEEDEARSIFHIVMSAVGYAHNQHICHRDMKLDNILLKKKNSLADGVKIADFGLSDFYRPGATVRTNCGTLSYQAPEVFHGTSNAGPPLDVWAMGVILFALLCGRLPFERSDLSSDEQPMESVIRQRILQGQYKMDDNLDISPEAKDLVNRMLKLDPNERASVPEIFSHCWLRVRNLTILDLQPVARALPSASSPRTEPSSPRRLKHLALPEERAEGKPSKRSLEALDQPKRGRPSEYSGDGTFSDLDCAGDKTGYSKRTAGGRQMPRSRSPGRDVVLEPLSASPRASKSHFSERKYSDDGHECESLTSRHDGAKGHSPNPQPCPPSLRECLHETRTT